MCNHTITPQPSWSTYTTDIGKPLTLHFTMLSYLCPVQCKLAFIHLENTSTKFKTPSEVSIWPHKSVTTTKSSQVRTLVRMTSTQINNKDETVWNRLCRISVAVVSVVQGAGLRWSCRWGQLLPISWRRLGKNETAPFHDNSWTVLFWLTHLQLSSLQVSSKLWHLWHFVVWLKLVKIRDAQMDWPLIIAELYKIKISSTINKNVIRRLRLMCSGCWSWKPID